MCPASIRSLVCCGAWTAAVMVCACALADEPGPPLVTAATAEQRGGQLASIELTVVEVKFAQRRKLHFLSGSANFRSESNMPVAIRAGDFKAFQKAGVADLSAKYLDKRIRARGKVMRDEGQWLLLVATPSDIDLVDQAGIVERLRTVLIVDEQGQETKVAFPLAAEVERATAAVEHEGAKEEFRGVALAELLTRAKILLGAESRGDKLRRYVLVTGHDGYVALFSIVEIDPFFAQQPPLLADELNGASLPALYGPLRVVVPGDKHRRRWVGQVAKIEVHNAAAVCAAEKPATPAP